MRVTHIAKGLGLLVIICTIREITASNGQNSSPYTDIPTALNYKAFLKKYKKSYKPLEETSRARYFYLRSIDIFKSNVLYVKDKKSHYLHQNKYIDLLPEEVDRILMASNDGLAPVRMAEEFPDTPAIEFIRSAGRKSKNEIHDTVSRSSLSDISHPKVEQHEGNVIKGEGLDSFAATVQYPKVNPSALLQELMKQPRLIEEMSNYITINPKASNSDYERMLESKKNEITKQPLVEPTNPNFDPSTVQSRGSISDNYRFRHMYTDVLVDDFLGILEPYPTPYVDEDYYEDSPNLLSGIMDSLRALRDAFVISGDDEILKNNAEKAKLIDESGKSSPLIDDTRSKKTGIEYNIDWRENGCVPRVKDQGKCNSCYAFAALDLLEYIYCRQTGVSTEFSVQYLIDCGSEQKLEGCRGGKLTNVEKFITSRGLQVDSLYPYTASEQTCKYQNKDRDAAYLLKPQIKTWAMFSDYRDWHKWLPLSPLIVGINMPSDFLVYGGGVHNGLDCVPKMGHAMLLVGAGKEDGQLFWLLKNNLSEEWGEKGYFRLSRDAPLKCFNSLFVARVAFNQAEKSARSMGSKQG